MIVLAPAQATFRAIPKRVCSGRADGAGMIDMERRGRILKRQGLSSHFFRHKKESWVLVADNHHTIPAHSKFHHC
eukprot:scaffold5865_cov186-Amphora_coffeaeformis.AAC.6